MPQSPCRLLPKRISDDENEVDSPCVVMTFTATHALNWLAQLRSRSIIRGHYMCQLMKACVFAFSDIEPVIRADLHPMLSSVSVAHPSAAHNAYRIGVCRERGLEPFRSLNGMDVNCAVPIGYCLAILDEHCVRQVADRQACRQLSVICRSLKPGQPLALAANLNLPQPDVSFSSRIHSCLKSYIGSADRR
jgi:hypothetical protein